MQATYENRYARALVNSKGYLYNLSVIESVRGQGHGEALLATICAEADADGQDLHLDCDEELVAWYSRHGFERTDRPSLGEVAMTRTAR